MENNDVALGGDGAGGDASSASGGASPGGSSGEEKPNKKKGRRRPLWLLIPLSYATVPVDGKPQAEWGRSPASYRLVRCTSKKEIQDALTAAQIDVTNAEHVLLLRADPTPLQLQNQVIIKWS